MEQVIPTVPPEEKPMGGASKILNLFFEPKRVFESLKIKPTWLVPFIIVALLGIGFFYSTYPYMMNQQVERIRDNDKIPEEQKQVLIDKMTEKAHPPVWQLFLAPLGTIVVLVVVAGILFFAFNVILGGDSSFRRVFSVYCYSSLIGVPAIIVKYPLIMLKKDLNVQTSLALLLSAESKNSFLYSLLSSFDIFTIWQLILVSIGMGILYKYSTKKAFTTVCILWIIWVVAKSGLSSLFGGMFGL
ncbi:MAG TPA: Yip1 family protein [candidate division Zixibacteria bacterium]